MKISPRLEDPLREARLAVHRGRFREAVDRLTALGNRLESTPEWLLLMSMARWRLGDFSASHRLADYARIEYRSRGGASGSAILRSVAARSNADAPVVVPSTASTGSVKRGAWGTG